MAAVPKRLSNRDEVTTCEGVVGSATLHHFDTTERCNEILHRSTPASDHVSATDRHPITRRKATEPSAWEERQSIARELHDAFPQEFQVILLHLRLAQRAGDITEAMRYVNHAMTSAQQGLASARDLVRRLRCGAEQEAATGTEETWAAAAEVIEHSTLGVVHGLPLNISTCSHGVRYQLGPHLAPRVAPLIREAVRNVVKHAMATRIELVLDGHDECLCIEIRDDGQGFNAFGSPGFGMRGMHERAAAMGAGLVVASGKDGFGTRVCLTLPSTMEHLRPIAALPCRTDQEAVAASIACAAIQSAV